MIVRVSTVEHFRSDTCDCLCFGSKHFRHIAGICRGCWSVHFEIEKKNAPSGHNSSGELGWAELRGKTPGWVRIDVSGESRVLRLVWNHHETSIDDLWRFQISKNTGDATGDAVIAYLYVVFSPFDSAYLYIYLLYFHCGRLCLLPPLDKVPRPSNQNIHPERESRCQVQNKLRAQLRRFATLCYHKWAENAKTPIKPTMLIDVEYCWIMRTFI